jgi:hypothetical protein
MESKAEEKRDTNRGIKRGKKGINKRTEVCFFGM